MAPIVPESTAVEHPDRLVFDFPMRSPPCRSTHPGKQGRVYSRTRFFVPKQSADGAGCGRPEGADVAGNLEWQKQDFNHNRSISSSTKRRPTGTRSGEPNLKP